MPPGAGSSVMLCEQDDLASHTSSASSKLIHGGLRYLEQYEFRLVREALIEREVLLRAAPHIIWPLRFVLPHDRGQRPAWLIRLGLFLYDHLGGRRRLPALAARSTCAADPAGAAAQAGVRARLRLRRLLGRRRPAGRAQRDRRARARRRDPDPDPLHARRGAPTASGMPSSSRRPAARRASCARARWSTPPGPGSRASSPSGCSWPARATSAWSRAATSSCRGSTTIPTPTSCRTTTAAWSS